MRLRELFGRIAASMSGVRGGNESTERPSRQGKRPRRSTSGRRKPMVGAKAPKRIQRSAPPRVIEVAARSGGGDRPSQPPASDAILTATEVSRTPPGLADWQVPFEERSPTEQQIIINAAQQRMAIQHSMNQEAAMLGMQNSGATSQQMANQLSGIMEPLQGISRDRPYWESMYGMLGQAGRPFLPSGRSGK